MRKRKDITGRKYGRLLVLRDSPTGKCAYCRCDCGKEVEVPRAYLFNGNTQSCGCKRREVAVTNMARLQNKIRQYGTNIDRIVRKAPNSNNKTGCLGVSRVERTGKYQAYICFRKNRKYLGQFDTLGEASEARQKAEQELFWPAIREHALEMAVV